MVPTPDPNNKGKICKHTPRKIIKTQSQPPLYVQWISCSICQKMRKVPGHMEISRLKKFICSMNIWDPPYADCSVPEEEDKENASIDLQGNYNEYEQEKEQFMEKLKQYHRDSGSGVVLRTPTLGRKEVDLYRLFREVSSYGGACSVVSKEGTWARIYRGMDNFSPTETSASFRLKKMYNKYLLQFERHVFNFDESLPPSNTSDNTSYYKPEKIKWGNNPTTQITKYIPAATNALPPWICTECGSQNTNSQYCRSCQTPRKKRKISSEKTEHDNLVNSQPIIVKEEHIPANSTASNILPINVKQETATAVNTTPTNIIPTPTINANANKPINNTTTITTTPDVKPSISAPPPITRKESLNLLYIYYINRFTRKESFCTLPPDGTPVISTTPVYNLIILESLSHLVR